MALPEIDKKALRDRFKNATVNAESFARTYSWCELEHCRGVCCRGGVWLEPEESKYVKENEAYLREKLPGVGIKLDANHPLLDESDSMDRFVAGTNTRPFDYSDQPQLAKDLEQTSCVFRRDDGACGLQLLGVSEGKPAWHYKPFYCFLYPIDISDENGKMMIEIIKEEEDEFSHKTMCGQMNPNGKPGYVIFAREIATLSEVLGRDIMAEIRQGLGLTNAA